MADLDAELLALAGDDSSGEESVAPSPKPKSPSPTRSKLPARESPLPDTSRKGTSKNSKRTKRRKEYSDDEDDMSVASERSESVSMSQSGSEGGYSPDAGKPIFPYERLYYDATDKARIDSKNEIEREEILAQRSEQLERHEQDLTLRRLVAARAREEAKNAAKNKRKASAADLDDNQRKSSRQRTKVGGGRVGEASSAIEAYKKQRAEKSLREEQRKHDSAARRPVSRGDSFSDVDAEGESDNDDYDRRFKKRTPTPPKDEPMAELRDLNHIRIGRENFAQVCYNPGFEEALTDCYARVCIGPGKTPGQNDYRLCRIKGFTKGPPYAMVAPNGRPFPVNQYIIAAHGKAERAWSFLECSMSTFTDEEWRRYRAVMANDDCKLPTKTMVEAKSQAVNAVIFHRFSEAEISHKMKRQNDLYDEIYRTQEKDALKEKLKAAIAAGQDDLADELEEKLANIVPKKLAFGTTLERKDPGYVDKNAERLAELNRRNMKLNAENIRKAQLAEMRARKMKKHLAPGVDELFEGGSDISRSGTPVNGISTPKLAAHISRTNTPKPMSLANGTPRSTTPIPTLVKPAEKKKGLPVIRKAATDDEIVASMDLGIDIDIDI